MLYTIGMVVAVVLAVVVCALGLLIGDFYLKYRAEIGRKRNALHEAIYDLCGPFISPLTECIDFLRRIEVVHEDDNNHVFIMFGGIRDYISTEDLATVIRWILKWSSDLDHYVISEFMLMTKVYRDGKERVRAILKILEEESSVEYERILPLWKEALDEQAQLSREEQTEAKIKKCLEALEIEEPDPLAPPDNEEEESGEAEIIQLP